MLTRQYTIPQGKGNAFNMQTRLRLQLGQSGERRLFREGVLRVQQQAVIGGNGRVLRTEWL